MKEYIVYPFSCEISKQLRDELERIARQHKMSAAEVVVDFISSGLIIHNIVYDLKNTAKVTLQEDGKLMIDVVDEDTNAV